MSQPYYGPCRCHACRGIHCLIDHPGHSCKFPSQTSNQLIENMVFGGELDWSKEDNGKEETEVPTKGETPKG